MPAALGPFPAAQAANEKLDSGEFPDGTQDRLQNAFDGEWGGRHAGVGKSVVLIYWARLTLALGGENRGGRRHQKCFRFTNLENLPYPLRMPLTSVFLKSPPALGTSCSSKMCKSFAYSCLHTALCWVEEKGKLEHFFQLTRRGLAIGCSCRLP